MVSWGQERSVKEVLTDDDGVLFECIALGVLHRRDAAQRVATVLGHDGDE